MGQQEKEIEGVVREVMETFPLQLEVESHGQRIHVMLGMETDVTCREETVDASILTPGLRISAGGEMRSPGGMTARWIRVLTLPGASGDG